MAICSSVRTLNCTRSVSVWAGSPKRCNVSLWASRCSQYSAHQGGRCCDEGEQHDWKESDFYILSCDFFFFTPELIFHCRAGSIHLNLLFLCTEKVDEFKSLLAKLCERVHTHTHTLRLVCVSKRGTRLSVCQGTALLTAVSDLAASQFDRATEPEGKERWRDNGNGGWKKANTIFNEFPWLSLPVSGSGSFLTEYVGGLRTIEHKKNRVIQGPAEKDFYIKEPSPSSSLDGGKSFKLLFFFFQEKQWLVHK